MPSPFPGMDPYLELPEFFPDFHDRLVTHLSESLQAALPAPYYAVIGSRVWVEQSQRRIEPDVDVLRGPDARHFADVSSTGAAILDEPIVVTVPHDEQRETFVDIIAPLDGERLVTTVEVLSLANKTPGEHGRDLYLRKQREVLYGKTNLVEIDLLRGGRHTTAVPLDRARARCGEFDYHAVVHRFDNLEDFFVYPVLLEQRLPTIQVPLLPPDSGISLDLQALLDRCYDAGPYRRRMRYELLRTVPPLSPQRAAWVASLLKGA